MFLHMAGLLLYIKNITVPDNQVAVDVHLKSTSQVKEKVEPTQEQGALPELTSAFKPNLND